MEDGGCSSGDGGRMSFTSDRLSYRRQRKSDGYEDAPVFIAVKDGRERAVGWRWMEKMQRPGLSDG